MPADHGIGSLGLLMELGGALFMATYAFLAISVLFASGGGAGSETGWMFLFAVASAVRSSFHRRAGRAMIYGAPGGALQPTRVYIAVSAVHTVIALFCMHKLFAPIAEFDPSFAAPLLPLIAAFGAWPAALAVIVTRPRFKAMADATPPQAEDLGFEGVAVLMSLMGVVGLATTAFMLIGGVKAAGSPFANGPVFFLSLIMVVLAARSFLHTKAGLSGVRGDDPHTFHDKAQAYYNFGVIAAIVAGAGLFIMFTALSRGNAIMQVMPMVAMLVYVLVQWPLMLKRFFTERNFNLLLAGDQAPTLRRAPDAGLTALGWLLLATSVTALATHLATLLSPAGRGGQDTLLFAVNLMGQLAPQGLDRWLPLVGTALQLWAGIELVTMSERHRLGATVFGVFGIAATLVVHWDVFESMGAFGSVLGRGGSPFGSVEDLLPIVMSLVAPVGTLLLIHRKNIATARVVSPPQQR